jgi:hypothetical protein
LGMVFVPGDADTTLKLKSTEKQRRFAGRGTELRQTSLAAKAQPFAYIITGSVS